MTDAPRSQSLPMLLREVRACTRCAASLPEGPRPLLQASADARLLLIGQAPGREAHRTGIPWDDRSGARLRAWLGLDDATFYDAARVALMPMGFCFPGSSSQGDLAPRPECAPAWHDPLRRHLTRVALTVYIGRHAFEAHLADRAANLTAAVRASADLLPSVAAVPHPSPRNNRWLARHPWFERDVLPLIRRRVRAVLRTKPARG